MVCQKPLTSFERFCLSSAERPARLNLVVMWHPSLHISGVHEAIKSRSRVVNSSNRKRVDIPWLGCEIGLLILALAWTSHARASDPAGTVIDHEGKGVPGIQVSAIGRSWDQPESSAYATTDSSGRFLLAGAWKLGAQEMAYLGLFARAPDGRCGWVATIWRQQPDSADVTITLSDVGEVSAQLVDQEGKPIAKAEVTVDSLDRFPGKPGQYDAIRLPAAIAKHYAARSGTDGNFLLRGIPKTPGSRPLSPIPRSAHLRSLGIRRGP